MTGGLPCALCPSLGALPCGARPAILRNWPDRPGVWLATGHEGLGIATAPATAALLAAQMLGQSAELPLAPYLPARLLGEAPVTYA